MITAARTIALSSAAVLTFVGCTTGDSDDDTDDTEDVDDSADADIDDVSVVDDSIERSADEDGERSTTTPNAAAPRDDAAPVAIVSPARIEPGMTWHWQLQGDVDTTIDADVFDIDLFDTSTAVIDDLHDRGRVVICYFSTAWEDWRDDAGAWPAQALGAPLDDWEGERWVDIRDAEVRELLAARLDLAVDKGCDAVEPDNVTAYRNDTGFDLSNDDQLDFNRYLASEASDRGLLIGLKNALEQIPDLVDHFDFAVNEQCVQYDECEVYEPFAAAGKVVFGAEYSDEALADPAGTCATAASSGVSTLILPLDLDGSFRITCS